MELVVSNDGTSLRERIVQNLKDCDGKEISVVHALRNLPTLDGTTAILNDLVYEGIVDRRIQTIRTAGDSPFNRVDLMWYRYCGENDLFNRPNLKVVS